MGSYKWSYKSLIWAVVIVTLLITPLIITTHEPPSRALWITEWVNLRASKRLLIPPSSRGVGKDLFEDLPPVHATLFAFSTTP